MGSRKTTLQTACLDSNTSARWMNFGPLPQCPLRFSRDYLHLCALLTPTAYAHHTICACALRSTADSITYNCRLFNGKLTTLSYRTAVSSKRCTVALTPRHSAPLGLAQHPLQSCTVALAGRLDNFVTSPRLSELPHIHEVRVTDRLTLLDAFTIRVKRLIARTSAGI